MTVQAAPSQSFAHSGTFFNVLGLALKNALLTVLTLTLYRFWARTSMRRRLWSRAWIMGDPLEYTGSAMELVRGFFIALPCFFLPAMFVLYVAPLVMEQWTAAWLLLGFYIVSVPLIAAARYWMRRYQLTRTRWRGIRMGLGGSARKFAFASWGWWVLQVLSLGWYTPAARINRARLMWEHTRFGDQQFVFADDGESPQKGLWAPFAVGWVLFAISIVVVPVAMAFLSAVIATGLNAGGGEVDPNVAPIIALVTAVAMLAGYGLAWLMCWAPYNAAAMNRIAGLISIDGARFRLRAKTVSLFLVTLAGWVIFILSFGLLAPVAGFLRVRYVISRLELVSTPGFAEIGQSVVAGPRSGEGLGDAFDLDMGVGVI